MFRSYNILFIITLIFIYSCEKKPQVNIKSDFTFQDSMEAPADIYFSPSENTPSFFKWTFGDSSESTDKNPRHFYQRPGRYKVNLTVSRGGSSVTENKIITVLDSPVTKIYITKIILNAVEWKKNIDDDWDTGSGPEIFPYAYMTSNIFWYYEPYFTDVQKKDLPLSWIVSKPEPFYRDWHPEIHFYDFDYGDSADDMGILHLDYNAIPKTDTIYNKKENGLDVTLHLRFGRDE